MTTVAIALNDELQDFVTEAVKSGRFVSESAVIAEALSEFKGREAFLVHEVDDLREKLLIGLEQADRGEFVEFTAEGVKRDGRERISVQAVAR